MLHIRYDILKLFTEDLHLANFPEHLCSADFCCIL